jgi:hypothetical protein
MRFRKYNIQFRYQGEADVLVLQSEIGAPLLRRAISSLRCSELHLGRPYFIFRPQYIFWFLRYWCSTSKSVANVCAHIRSHGIRAVVGMDYLDVSFDRTRPEHTLFQDCSRLVKHVHFFTIQHSWFTHLRAMGPAVRNLTLLTFGSQSAGHFPKHGRRECQFSPIGSLALSDYLSVRPVQSEKKYQICVVSSIRAESFFTQADERDKAFAALVDLLQQIDRNVTVPTVVALGSRPFGTSRASEKLWFASRVGPEVEFTDPNHKFGGLEPELGEVRIVNDDALGYSTYYASDLSEVTLGGTSTVLWESFARGNKILAVNMTRSDVLDFPEPGIWSMRNPSAAEFENRLNEILGIDPERWLALSGAARERLIMSDSRNTTAERLAFVIHRAATAI